MTPYQPRHFRVEDHEHALAVLHAHPFATLVSLDEAGPLVTHLPLHLQRAEGGCVLLGHLARANPHQAALQDGAQATAIFHGGDAFVSPSCYVKREAVPTWNYIVVHVLGRIARVDDSEGKELILKALIDRHDPPYHATCNELSPEFRERMKGAIVGLRLEVAQIHATFKLSQNRPAADQKGVLQALQRGDAAAQGLADWMRRLAIGTAV